MNVFIDTNILLNFYHFTSDDLDALNSVFVSYTEGAVSVYLTDQIRDEFNRGREPKLQSALKQFSNFNLSAQLPYFMKAYEEYATLQELSKKFNYHAKNISKKVDSDILKSDLRADHLIGDIFEKSDVLETTDAIYAEARKRVDLGNPPGKKGSIGDAINWLLLLDHVPEGEVLFIVTEDSDFYSKFNEHEISPFLENEWRIRKNSALKAYRSIKYLFTDHYDGVHVSYDEEKKSLIDALETCFSFAHTHAVVAKLHKYKYYSLQEAKAILDAADANPQFGMISGDKDVAALLKTAVLPHRDKLTKASHKELLEPLVVKEDPDSLPF